MKKIMHKLSLVMAVFICLMALGACGNSETKSQSEEATTPIGFNEATNQNITFQGINFSIPAYYDFKDPLSTLTNTTYYPENEDYSSTLHFEAQEMAITPANFKAAKQGIAQTVMENFDNADIAATTEEITVAGLSGFHVSFSAVMNGVSGTGHVVLINNIYMNELIMILQMHDSNDQSDFDYDGDFLKILETATLTKAASEYISTAPDESVETSKPSTGELVGSGDLGDYYVEIKSGQLTKDYKGDPACVITYSWTNNSDETTSALLSIKAQAFQDGVELDQATILNSDVYEAGTRMKDVRPGATIDVQCAFVLANQTSDVEIELSKQFDFMKDGPKVIKVFHLQ